MYATWGVEPRSQVNGEQQRVEKRDDRILRGPGCRPRTETRSLEDGSELTAKPFGTGQWSMCFGKGDLSGVRR